MLIELFSLSVTAEAQRANIDWKSAFVKGLVISTKFSRRRDVTHKHFFHG